MPAMPAMDEEGKEGKAKPKGGVDLAIVFGKPKKGGEPDGDEPPPEGGEDLPAGFEDAIAEAFPEMAGDTERISALKRAIHLCTDSY